MPRLNKRKRKWTPRKKSHPGAVNGGIPVLPILVSPTVQVPLEVQVPPSLSPIASPKNDFRRAQRHLKKSTHFDPSDYLGSHAKHRAGYVQRSLTRLKIKNEMEKESVSKASSLAKVKDVNIRLVLENYEVKKHLDDTSKYLSARCEATMSRMRKVAELKDQELTKMQKHLGLNLKENATRQERRTALGKGVNKLSGMVLGTWNNHTRAHSVVREIIMGGTFGFEAGNSVSRTVARSHGNQVIEPWRVAKALDTSTVGGCNVRGVQTLWEVEDKKRDPNDIFDRRGHALLPSRHAVSDDRARLQGFIQKTIELVHEPENKNGDTVRANFEQLFRYLLKRYGLHETAQQESVEICISIDAAQVTKKSHTTAGFKFTDTRCANPNKIDENTGEPELMFITYDDNGFLTYSGIQSRDNCAVAQVVLASETKEVIKSFALFFEFATQLEKVGLPAKGNEPALKPFRVLCPADKSALQKLTNRGGACKNAKYFCTYCSCHSDLSLMSHKTGDDVCEVFCMSSGRNICRHWAVEDMDERTRMSKFLYDKIVLDIIRVNEPTYDWHSGLPENLRTTGFTDDGLPKLPYWEYVKYLKHTEELEHVTEQSVLEVVEGNVFLPKDNPQHLDFEALNGKKEHQHLSKVLCDLYLRKYSNDDLIVLSRAGKIELLRKRLKLGEKIKLCRVALDLNEKALRSRLVEIHQAIMCILHLENRTGEKYLYYGLYLIRILVTCDL